MTAVVAFTLGTPDPLLQQWCVDHNYPLHITGLDVYDATRPPMWSRIKAMQAYLSKYSSIVYMDANLNYQPNIEILSKYLPTNKDILVVKDPFGVLRLDICLLRKTPWVECLLDNIYQQDQWMHHDLTSSQAFFDLYLNVPEVRQKTEIVEAKTLSINLTYPHLEVKNGLGQGPQSILPEPYGFMKTVISPPSLETKSSPGKSLDGVTSDFPTGTSWKWMEGTREIGTIDFLAGGQVKASWGLATWSSLPERRIKIVLGPYTDILTFTDAGFQVTRPDGYTASGIRSGPQKADAVLTAMQTLPQETVLKIIL